MKKPIAEILQWLQDTVGEPDGELPDWGFRPATRYSAASIDLSPRAIAVIMSWSADHPEEARAAARTLREEST